MKIFCTNAFTGEDVAVVTQRMRMVVDELNKNGYVAYSPIFDPHKIKLQENNDTRAIFEYAFKNIAECDAMVAIITSERRSEGQLMEAGAALATGKSLFVFMHTSATSTHLAKLAAQSHTWSTDDELMQALSKITT